MTWPAFRGQRNSIAAYAFSLARCLEWAPFCDPVKLVPMLSGLISELRTQAAQLRGALKTPEFWIYFSVIVVLTLVALAGIYLAAGFDPLTRGQLKMAISCQTSEGQIGTIIVGCFVFCIACVFTLGEVTQWVEEKRLSRAPGRIVFKRSHWRPILHVLGTLVLGVGGYLLMSAWCS